MTPGLEVLPDKVEPALSVGSCQWNRALAPDKPHHLGYGILGLDRDHHVHMIAHQLPFFDPTLLLGSQLAKHFSQAPAQLPVQRLAPVALCIMFAVWRNVLPGLALATRLVITRLRVGRSVKAAPPAPPTTRMLNSRWAGHLRLRSIAWFPARSRWRSPSIT